MDFSETFKISRSLVKSSPGGLFIACSCQNRLIVRDVMSMNELANWTCLDLIDSMKWSPNAKLLMTMCLKRSVIEIWRLDNLEWRCRINEGSVGLQDAYWTPSSLHILSLSDFHLKLTIWSLCSDHVACIKRPKLIYKMNEEDFCDEFFDFSFDCRFLAMAERKQCQDFICVFDMNGQWQMLNRFLVESENLQGIKFSPSVYHAICVWDCPTTYRILLYMIDGQKLASYSAYSDALGVSSVVWSPTSQFLSVGSFDCKCRLLNHITWTVVAEFDHPNQLTETLIIYKERSSADIPNQFSFEVCHPPIKLPFVKLQSDDKQPVPPTGVSKLAFSADGRFLYSVCDRYPSVLFIWSTVEFKMHSAIIFLKSVHVAHWHQGVNKLAICTGSDHFYLWSSRGMCAVKVPVYGYTKELGTTTPLSEITQLQWVESSENVLLYNSSKMVIAYLSP